MKLFAARWIYVNHYTFLNHLKKRFYFYNIILTFKVINHIQGDHSPLDNLERGGGSTPPPKFSNHIGLRLKQNFATGLVILFFKYDFSCCKYFFVLLSSLASSSRKIYCYLKVYKKISTS